MYAHFKQCKLKFIIKLCQNIASGLSDLSVFLKLHMAVEPYFSVFFSIAQRALYVIGRVATNTTRVGVDKVTIIDPIQGLFNAPPSWAARIVSW